MSRHERGESLPSILVAFAYEAIFGVPVANLFPGIYATVEQGIEARLDAHEAALSQTIAKGRKAPATARKLEWFCERKGYDAAL